jgi:peptide/nickel transport system permease protein
MGARSMVLVTLTATLVAGALGTGLGAISVYLAGGLGVLLARLVELSGSVPSIILVGLLRLWDPTGGVVSLVATLALLRTVEVAQLVRAKVLTTMPSDFVEASRALGASRRWQLRVHVLPHLARPLAANLAFGASSLVGLEAALSFAGLGLPPDVPSWGAALGQLARAGSGEALLLTVASLGLSSAALYWLGARVVAGLGGASPKGDAGPLAD